MITLPIKRKWFDMIQSGEKKEEYRNITSRYEAMFRNATKKDGTFLVCLRNGYSLSSPSMIVRVKCSIGEGLEVWGAVPGEKYFVLSILDIKE